MCICVLVLVSWYPYELGSCLAKKLCRFIAQVAQVLGIAPNGSVNLGYNQLRISSNFNLRRGPMSLKPLECLDYGLILCHVV
jgi:hypothetical protein